MKTAIQTKGLKFRWTEESPLVLDLEDFEIKRGSFTFLKGPSGSGKTTLLNLIGGVILPTEGEITVLDQHLKKLNNSIRDSLRGENMGFVFQQFNLLPYLSVAENIALPLEWAKNKRQKVQNAGGINKEIERLLRSLRLNPGDVLKKQSSKLSVGQQQRVAAARALIGSPELVIADEPTSALDADSRMAFLDLLFSECRRSESTLVFVSHDSSLATNFDEVIDLTKINRAYVREEFL